MGDKTLRRNARDGLLLMGIMIGSGSVTKNLIDQFYGLGPSKDQPSSKELKAKQNRDRNPIFKS